MTEPVIIRLQRKQDGTYVVWTPIGGNQWADGRGNFATKKQVLDLPEYQMTTMPPRAA